MGYFSINYFFKTQKYSRQILNKIIYFYDILFYFDGKIGLLLNLTELSKIQLHHSKFHYSMFCG